MVDAQLPSDFLVLGTIKENVSEILQVFYTKQQKNEEN